VIDAHTAFAHHRLEIAAADAAAAVPPHRPQHDFALEVAPLEVRHGQPLAACSDHIPPDSPDLCNRTVALGSQHFYIRDR
jgi:hypothetical protein